MPKKSDRNVKGDIVVAAWKLFYEQGYDETTIDDIIETSNTSKGSFYHYFEGKDDLLSSLSYLFDEKYQEISEELDFERDSFEILMELNHELFSMIEDTISVELMARLYSTQVITHGERNLLDHDRYYYRLLRKIINTGKQRGELSDDITVSEAVKMYALCERALIYDWCICNGEYSLHDYANKVMPLLLSRLRR
ncbi:MAG: TetR/AcrR family transcriptional regulator [Lachnospiraceae bacterium]|nr:TetR/AcrR family transcriptional regulator [Lachnospiraceae bacterium]